MSQAIILEGDHTSTGGRMIASQTSRKSSGKNVILIGDKYYCPSCKSTGSIVQASDLQFVRGVGVAFHGCRVQCGCPGQHMVIATQSIDLVDVKSGSSKQQNLMGLASQPQVIYEQQFVLVDEFTQEPLINRFYKILRNGETITGKTDEQGKTQKMEAAEVFEVFIEVYPENYEE